MDLVGLSPSTCNFISLHRYNLAKQGVFFYYNRFLSYKYFHNFHLVVLKNMKLTHLTFFECLALVVFDPVTLVDVDNF